MGSSPPRYIGLLQGQACRDSSAKGQLPRTLSLRERIVEHVFIGDALRSLWRLKVTVVDCRKCASVSMTLP